MNQAITPTTVMSLRTRLFWMILLPLVLVSLLLGSWRYTVAEQTAEELFDRGLLATALAISRDVIVSEGDALSITTRDLIRDANGGELFYHVTGPGGIYITGYAYPPRIQETAKSKPIFALAEYRSEPVRVLKMTERTTVDNMSGDTTITVWQRIEERNRFARTLGLRAASLMTVLLATLALVVWFGVQRGLRPLHDLHDAIALRSPDDLSQIKRPLPREVFGIVATLNRLFKQVETNIEAHQVFISDAAHQLRNPTAAVLSLAETLSNTTDPNEQKRRTKELIDAARASARLTDQLLSLERLRHDQDPQSTQTFDLSEVTEIACAAMATQALNRDIDFEFTGHVDNLPVQADRAMTIEAIKNLIDNALKHGGPNLTAIQINTDQQIGTATVTIKDNGKGLDPKDAQKALRRFSQLEPSQGSGLGLAIASTVAEKHDGHLKINETQKGASFTFGLPIINN